MIKVRTDNSMRQRDRGCKDLRSIFINIFLTVVFLFTLIGCSRTTTVNGKLLDVNGNSSRYAMVGISPSSREGGDHFITCDNDGSYSIKISKPGVNYLVYSIPGHDQLKIPILNDTYKELTVDVNLAAYQYVDNFDEVALKTRDNPSVEKMTKLEDGTYVYEKQTNKDKILYQLCKINYWRPVNSPDAISFVHDDKSGDYWSVVKPEGGKFRVIFDPKKLLRKNDPYKITFHGSDFDRKFSQIMSDHDKMLGIAAYKCGAYYLEHHDFKGFVYDEGDYLIDFVKRVEKEKDDRLSKLMKLIYLTTFQNKFKHLDTIMAREYLNSVPPEDSAWCFIPDAFGGFMSLYPDSNQQAAVLDDFLEKTKSIKIKTGILQIKFLDAYYSNNTEELEKLRDLISNDYKDVKELQDLLRKYTGESSKLKNGSEIPDYEVSSFENPKEKYSKRSMLGKVYLIDFWFTTCRGCIEEMPYLHKTYDKYKNKGFDILSLSVDSEELVNIFRKYKWKMPWKNSVINRDEKILVDFEVKGFPTTILVDVDGKVLMKEAKELRGDKLDETLAKFLK
jgi:thiol-disulfide isomerase/thioredoxin